MPRRRKQCGADDEELADRFLAGDRAAFDVLVLRHQDRLYRFVSWSIGHNGADDVTQDVFVEVHRSLANWGRRSSFRTWLYGVARNVCRHHLRQVAGRALFLVGSDVDDAPDIAASPFEHLAEREESAELMTAIAQLPRSQRITLMLRAWEGLSYDEIAAITNVPKGTVRSRLHNARRKLAQSIAQKDAP